MAIKIKVSYQIVENSTNPPTVLAPTPSTFYEGNFDTAEQLKQFVIANAEAKVAQTAAPAAQAVTIRDQVAG